MGQLFGWETRKELIAHLIDESGWENTKVVAHSARGNVLWTVRETDGKRWIGCDLMVRSGGEWGYKPMDESVHPYYYTCPLKYLDLAPEVANQEWRDKVRLYHERMNRKFKVGQVVKLVEGATPAEVEITSLSPLRGLANGSIYRVPRTMVA